MILFQLRCDQDHRFEGWFRNNDAYEQQAAGGLLSCPLCGRSDVRKAPMAPSIARSHADRSHAARSQAARRPNEGDGPEAATPAVATPPTVAAEAPVADMSPQAELLLRLRELRRMVESTAENVGPDFAEEARRIHYGETPERPIYGDTTAEEATALTEEGVTFTSIPWLPTHDA
jgi:hypothetical protein